MFQVFFTRLPTAKMGCPGQPHLTAYRSLATAIKTTTTTPFALGILRETYDKWERRAPLTPDQCRDFLNETPGSKIFVQPSSHRIFPDQQYVEAGAAVQESLHEADVVLGVKRPHPSVNIQDIFREQQTSMFFSHTIKGQPENLELLRDLLDQRVQLIDYEKITVPTEGKRERRLVAFGKYAGLAGAIDTLSVVGQRLLCSGLSTPFLNVSPSIYHASLDDAKRAVQRAGERIALDGLGNVRDDGEGLNGPLVFCMTGGPRGNVYSGVREIFDILPHEIVAVDDLPALYDSITNSSSSSSPPCKVYGVVPEMKDIYRLNSDEGASFDRAHFVDNPEMYHSTFAERIAKYIHVFINSIYWEHRFPRLLSRDDMFRLYDTGNKRLMVISDISCDYNGSVEFLDRSTSIDRPCFQYDPFTGEEFSDTIGDRGVTVFGVDILPTELPLESSEHFGKALKQVLSDLVNAKTTFHQEAFGKESVPIIDAKKLSLPLSRALITTEAGALSDDFKYLEILMEHNMPRQSSLADRPSMLLALEGHLFDSGLINQVLDVLEITDCAFEFKECNVEYRPKGEPPIKSSAILEVSGAKNVDMDMVQRKIEALAEAIVTAETTIHRMDTQQAPTRAVSAVVESGDNEKTVLLLGSGRVSMSVVDWLGRNPRRRIIVSSNDENDARALASMSKNGKGSAVVMDIGNDPEGLSRLVEQSDLVISLLPATMHSHVAELCIDASKDLVTASYESKEMAQLGKSAQAAGVLILNEVGLDPGLDHMSAMKLIDGIHVRGGQVTSFSSVCGGLPAPEAAQSNPLRYKFSWSPRGVISASQNDAKYLWEDNLVQVRGNELLASAIPFSDAWSDLDLECLPNRNSLKYCDTYGLDIAKTLFRGTLRYRGFSALMHVFQTMKLFDAVTSIDNLKTWDDVLGVLSSNHSEFASIDDFLLASSGNNVDLARQSTEALKWLGMYGSASKECFTKSVEDRTIVDLFCRRLEERLKYGTIERDMVVMHHKIVAEFNDGSIEEHHSSLQAFGTEATMTAMCKTVGYPAAAAADLILTGQLDESKCGLLLPTTKDIYIPILEAVKQEGIDFVEHVSVLQYGDPDSNFV